VAERDPAARADAPGRSTLSVHAGDVTPVAGGPVVNPIHQTTTFFSDPEGGDEVLYTRYGNNPNHRLVEERIRALEGAGECVVFASGMAAMASAVLSCTRSGDHVVAASPLYGGTRTLLDREMSRLGISTGYVDPFTPGWESAIRENTRLIVIEVPTNPLIRVPDAAAIARVARAAGVMLLVDATFATPINFRGAEHGVDLVVHSATKYLGGHSDVTAGAVCGSPEAIERVRDRARIFGASLDPHAAWLLERGIKTLALRMERHNANGLEIARWCDAGPRSRRSTTRDFRVIRTTPWRSGCSTASGGWCRSSSPRAMPVRHASSAPCVSRAWLPAWAEWRRSSRSRGTPRTRLSRPRNVSRRESDPASCASRWASRMPGTSSRTWSRRSGLPGSG
jgi:O-acetylhomoserine/O-acetylserine sulfhydrylase-like pyridoxal-dependent enzyme